MNLRPSRCRCGLRSGNRLERGEDRYRILEAGVALFLKGDLKRGDDVSIPTGIRYKFPGSILKCNTYIKGHIPRLQNIVLHCHVGRQAAPRRDRNDAERDIPVTQRRETKLILGQGPQIGIIRNAERITRG